MEVQQANLQHLCDAFMSTWSKISEEHLQHVCRIKKVKRPSDSKVYLIKWLMSLVLLVFPHTLPQRLFNIDLVNSCSLYEGFIFSTVKFFKRRSYSAYFALT